MNKKLLSLLMAVVMVFSLVIPVAADEAEESNIVILHTNDTHCDIENDHGFAGVAGYKALMEAEGNYVTLVDGGDFVQGGPIGALTDGEYIIDIMNEVGYDVIVPGNHEYDYEVPQMLNLMDMLECDVVSSNFMDLTTGESVYDSYVIYSYGEVDIAYVGITTPESFTKTTPTYFMNEEGEYIYGFCEGNEGQDLYDNVQASVDAAIAEGADYVIALGHLGTEETSEPWRSTDVIANTTGIDVMIDGHSHTVAAGEEVLNLDGETVLMNQTGEKFNNIGKITITPEGEITAELVSPEDYDGKDETVQAFIDNINVEFDAILNAVVAYTDVDLTSTDPATGERMIRSQETNLGDLVADAYRTVLEADVAIVNGGGIRADIAAGDITYNDIIAVNPFGNNGTSIKVTGQVLLDALEMGASNTPGELGGFLQVSGMSYTIDTSIPSSVVTDDKGIFTGVDGEYRVTEVIVDGEPLDLEAEYVVASHDYMLLSFGDGMAMFEGAEVVKDRVIVDNETIIKYIVDTLGGVVGEEYSDPYGQGRITVLTAEVDDEDVVVDDEDVVVDDEDVVVEKEEAEEEAEEETESLAATYGVADDAWYLDAAEYVLTAGIMGSTDTDVLVFDGEATLTRAQVYETLYIMAGSPEVTEPATFVDIPEEAWYATSAAWAEQTGLSNGVGDDQYAGDLEITREQLAAIAVRYATLCEYELTEADVAEYDLADWAVDSYTLAVGSNLVALIEEAPADVITRGELAVVLMNLADLAPEVEEEVEEDTDTETEYEEVVIPNYTSYIVEIEVEETDGIPAHTIPATVTIPDGEGTYPVAVMLHGTGSTRDEAGNGYAIAAPMMAEAGIATIRIDFMGNGDSTADYTDYNYTSANIDAKAAADYMAGLENIDASSITVMGWSQGGTNALMAAATYPETFTSVITWAGSVHLDDAGLFPETGFDGAYDIALEEGSYTMTFTWREDLEVGVKWFEDVAGTDLMAEIASIEAPILAINGDLDTTVPMSDAEEIVAAAPNALLYVAVGADHTYNVFSGDLSALEDTVNTGISFILSQGSDAEGAAYATDISKYGNITTDMPVMTLAFAGYEAGDMLTVTVGEYTIEAPYGTSYSDVDNGSVIVLPDSATGMVAIAINMGDFATTYEVVAGETPITFAMAEKAGYLEEYELRNIDALRTNDREDYDSDAIFANFRNVVMGDLAEGLLYRSSSPVNPEIGRNLYADQLAEEAGIATFINLADSEEVLVAYEDYADSYYATANVITLDMGVDFFADDFNTSLKAGLEFLMANEGPYLVHCNEGKDRAGFTIALLEALAGGTAEEIIADYMVTYENYYHVDVDSDTWDSIASSNIVKSLCTITGTETQEEMEAVDLQAAAADYLVTVVGLSEDQVGELYAAITADVAVEAAA